MLQANLFSINLTTNIPCPYPTCKEVLVQSSNLPSEADIPRPPSHTLHTDIEAGMQSTKRQRVRSSSVRKET